MRRTWLTLLHAVLVLGLAPALGALAVAPGAHAAGGTHHLLLNTHGDSSGQSLGYDVFDTGPSLGKVPAGAQGMVWVGDGQKTPTRPGVAFKSVVNRLAHNGRVFGYYVADEPDLGAGGAAALRARCDYIRKASGGAQLSMIALYRRREFRRYNKAATHCDLVAVVAYPDSVNGLALSTINEKVRWAKRGGWPEASLVPAYQAFRDQYYRMPGPRQEHRILRRWHRLIPDPVLDYTYSWGHMGASSGSVTLVDRPGVQGVLRRWFAN